MLASRRYPRRRTRTNWNWISAASRDPKSHPIAVSWLPVFANAKLNELTGRARDNLLTARATRAGSSPASSVLPQTLFVLMLFAEALEDRVLYQAPAVHGASTVTL